MLGTTFKTFRNFGINKFNEIQNLPNFVSEIESVIDSIDKPLYIITKEVWKSDKKPFLWYLGIDLGDGFLLGVQYDSEEKEYYFMDGLNVVSTNHPKYLNKELPQDNIIRYTGNKIKTFNQARFEKVLEFYKENYTKLLEKKEVFTKILHEAHILHNNGYYFENMFECVKPSIFGAFSRKLDLTINNEVNNPNYLKSTTNFNNIGRNGEIMERIADGEIMTFDKLYDNHFNYVGEYLNTFLTKAISGFKVVIEGVEFKYESYNWFIDNESVSGIYDITNRLVEFNKRFVFIQMIEAVKKQRQVRNAEIFNTFRATFIN